MRLVNEDARIGQSKALLGGSSREQHSCHARRLTNADGHDVVFYKLHGVVDGHAGRDGSAGRVNVKLDVLLWIFCGQKEHLRDHKIGNGVVYGRANEDDIVLQKSGEDVVGAFSAAGLLYYHWNKSHYR